MEAGAPPWKSCVTKTNSVMGFATGYLYIKERAGKNAKQQVRTSEKFLNTVSREFPAFLLRKMFNAFPRKKCIRIGNQKQG